MTTTPPPERPSAAPGDGSGSDETALWDQVRLLGSTRPHPGGLRRGDAAEPAPPDPGPYGH